MVIFYDMVEDFVDVFMYFSLYFGCLLRYLGKVLAHCENTNLVLNWEKCHFLVWEGIVLVHKDSKHVLEVDKSKGEVIKKFPYLVSVKGV